MKEIQFERVVRQYKDLIYSYAYYFSGTREDAEDLTQEVLLRIWQSLDSIRVGPTKSWVSKVTRNLCIDWARRKRTRLDSPISLEARNRDEGLRAPLVEPSAERADLRRRIEGAIARLPEKLRTVIILREIGDLKYEEISQVLDMPLNSVKSYIHRGRRLLRERLRALYEDQYLRRDLDDEMY
ncbi:MAG: RNA polymerase sigma factor [bacterium]